MVAIRMGWNRMAAGALMALGLVAAMPQSAKAQGLVVDGPRYTLTMTAMGWDSIQVPEGEGADLDFTVLAKLQGLGGLSYVSCEPGTLPPDLDTLAADFASQLGGNITLGKDSSLTLGAYAVKWQEFKYDSLPALADMIQQRAGFRPTLKNGSFRVYYLVSGGYVFAMAGLAIMPNGIPPYADIQAAIAGLKLKPLAGAVREAARDLGGGLWTRDGLLGGAWLRNHPAASVDCFTPDGAFAGSARPDGDGAWILPASRSALVIVVRARDGRSRSLLTQP